RHSVRHRGTPTTVEPSKYPLVAGGCPFDWATTGSGASPPWYCRCWRLIFISRDSILYRGAVFTRCFNDRSTRVADRDDDKRQWRGGERAAMTRQHPVVDLLARPIHDLRISITDRCNFRCVYCMPKEKFGRGHKFLARRELLSFEELERVATIFAELGVRKLRITGGQPLLRHDVSELAR